MIDLLKNKALWEIPNKLVRIEGESASKLVKTCNFFFFVALILLGCIVGIDWRKFVNYHSTILSSENFVIFLVKFSRWWGNCNRSVFAHLRSVLGNIFLFLGLKFRYSWYLTVRFLSLIVRIMLYLFGRLFHRFLIRFFYLSK